MRSIAGAIQAKSLGIYLSNEWTRMGGMDYSDVGYDAFLINGKKDSQLLVVHPGEKIRCARRPALFRLWLATSHPNFRVQRAPFSNGHDLRLPQVAHHDLHARSYHLLHDQRAPPMACAMIHRFIKGRHGFDWSGHLITHTNPGGS